MNKHIVKHIVRRMMVPIFPQVYSRNWQSMHTGVPALLRLHILTQTLGLPVPVDFGARYLVILPTELLQKMVVFEIYCSPIFTF